MSSRSGHRTARPNANRLGGTARDSRASVGRSSSGRSGSTRSTSARRSRRVPRRHLGRLPLLEWPKDAANSRRVLALKASTGRTGQRSRARPRSPQISATRFRPPTAGGADRRSAFQAVPALFLPRRYALSLRSGQRCRSEDRRSQPAALPLLAGGPKRRRCLSKWWRRRESNPRPKVFCNDVYMHIRVVGGNPRPEAPFPLSVPHRINPANRGSEPIPCAHRRLGKTAGKARLGRRPFPPGRRGQEERGYLSSQCQFSVGFCFVSTVYERWTPDMQSLLHIPSSNPVRPPSSRD